MIKKKTTSTMCLSLIHTCLDLVQVSTSKGSEESGEVWGRDGPGSPAEFPVRFIILAGNYINRSDVVFNGFVNQTKPNQK